MDAITLPASEISRLNASYPAVFHRPLIQRLTPLLVTLGIAAYVVYSVWFFNLISIFEGGNWERASIEILQWVSYEARPTVRINGSALDVTWNRYDPLGYHPNPDWVTRSADGTVTISFGATSEISANATRLRAHRGDETVEFHRGPAGWVPVGSPPSWVKLQDGGARLSFGLSGSADVDTDRIGARRRFPGWANFVFDPDSPFWGKSWGEVSTLIVSGERIDPKRTNLALAFDNVWNNANWQHGDVWIKLLQTIVMAFVGTLFAAVVAFPLCFLGAANITRNRLTNQLAKRWFDFQRCVDMLVWALFFTRGFGPGPLAGIAAIFFTDVGTLGKTYTEALENIDDKQREGIRSLGASPVQVQRYGVVPQVLPVFASQALYQWESNTRSATIIGAMGAGGIGLKLLEAMRTNSNWANVCYMVVLILVVVYVFDTISSRLRRRLTTGS